MNQRIAASIAFNLLFLVGSLHSQQAASLGILRGPFLSIVTQNSIVASWTTSASTPSAVQYGTSPVYGSVVSDPTLLTAHSLKLTGLMMDASYHYRVIAGSDTSADYTFTTLPPPGFPFTFVVYGDSRTNHAAHVQVLNQIAPLNPRFVIHTGDLVASSTSSEWDAYFNDLCVSTSVGSRTANYSAMGNHDDGTLYYQYLYLPHNNPDSTEAYYSFDCGNVHFICLNTEISYSAGNPQYNWLVADLQSDAARRAAFKIAFWHIPPYSSGQHGSDLTVRAALCPVLESNGVDIVFTGHDHQYLRTTPFNRTTYIVAGGGGAPLYDFMTNDGWTAYREKAYNFCKVKVDSTSLRMWMVRSDGVVRDSLFITRTTSVLNTANPVVPQSAELKDNYPNPFNPSTHIEFTLAHKGDVTLEIADVNGKLVRTYHLHQKSEGTQEVIWDGRNDAGTPVSSGSYFYRLISDGSVSAKKMILLK